MRSILRVNKATSIHIAIFLLSGLVLLFRDLPMLGSMGIEAGNLFVLVLGPFFLLAAAIASGPGYRHILLCETKWFLAHLVFFASLLFINGTYMKSCSQGAGLLPFLVILIPPIMLNISVGALLGAMSWPRWLKVLLVLIGYASYYAWLLLSWWQQANFRVISHASVLVSSDLLQGDRLSAGVVGIRAATAILCLAVILLGLNFFQGRVRGLFGERLMKPSMAGFLITSLLVAFLLVQKKSLEHLGKHRSDLIANYNAMASRDGIVIRAIAAKTRAIDANNILDEALFYKQRIKRRLADVSEIPITIWLHHSDQERFLYTGAKNVHFSLPRHREIHISGYEIPHSVLGHELAHIYLGEKSKNIFGLLGSGYLFPNMALTEGLAVLLTEELNIDNGLSIHEQARAMYQAGVPFEPSRLFSDNPVNFALSHPSSAYIYAGAVLDFFLRPLAKAERAKKIAEIVAKGKDALFSGESMKKRMTELMEDLAKPVPAHAIPWARTHFPTKSILNEDCRRPRSDDRRFTIALLNADLTNIRATINDRLLRPDPKLVLIGARRLIEARKYDDALKLIDDKARPDLSTVDNIALELSMMRIEALILQRLYKDAAVALSELDIELLLPSKKRLFYAAEVFLRYAIYDDNAVGCLPTAGLALLFARPSDREAAGLDLSQCLARPRGLPPKESEDIDMLGRYLLARAYMNANHEERAIGLLLSLLVKRGNLSPLIEREAVMMLGKLNAKLKNYRTAVSVFEHLLRLPNAEGERLYLLDQIERIDFIR